MTEAGVRRLIIVMFGECCVFGLVCAGFIIDDMVQRGRISGPGCFFSLMELVLASVCGWIAWGAYHD